MTPRPKQPGFLSKLAPWNNPALWITILTIGGGGIVVTFDALRDIQTLKVAQADTANQLNKLPKVFPPVKTQREMEAIKAEQRNTRERLERIERDVGKVGDNVEDIKNFLLRDRNGIRR